MRFARLQSYNAYRQRFGLRPKKDWADLTGDVDVQERLAALYDDIDDLEWYVGIWAEDHPEDQMMGDLLTTMVGYDAFTQALTNPLLAPQVFNEATFTRAGMRVIKKTRSLQQILARNAADPAAAFTRFTYGPERRSRWSRPLG
jgi:prostaglandin-endoperoxide synthase 2